MVDSVTMLLIVSKVCQASTSLVIGFEKVASNQVERQRQSVYGKVLFSRIICLFEPDPTRLIEATQPDIRPQYPEDV